MTTMLNGLADTLMKKTELASPELAQDRQRYLAAMEAMENQLGQDPVREAMEAVRRQTEARLLFSAALGFRANRDHFLDPVARTFLEVEPELYLREETAQRLPDCAAGQEALRRLFAALSPDRPELREDVTAYLCHLETAGPKVAHYCGYILADTLLPRIVPGYHPDRTLTARYKTALEAYFGAEFPADL